MSQRELAAKVGLKPMDISRFEHGRRGLAPPKAQGRQDWVYQSEPDKLAGTSYTYAVNPNYAGEERAGFDILSFDTNGDWIYIEVKASKGGMNEPFYMSAAEFLFLETCLRDGVRYDLHRVSFVNDPAKRERVIYSAKDVLEKFDRESNNYQFTPKGVA